MELRSVKPLGDRACNCTKASKISSHTWQHYQVIRLVSHLSNEYVGLELDATRGEDLQAILHGGHHHV